MQKDKDKRDRNQQKHSEETNRVNKIVQETYNMVQMPFLRQLHYHHRSLSDNLSKMDATNICHLLINETTDINAQTNRFNSTIK